MSYQRITSHIVIITLVLLAGISHKTFANEAALKTLLSSIEGEPTNEKPRVYKTPDGYVRFIGTAAGTYLAIDPAKV